MNTLDSTWQDTEPLLGPAIHKLKPDICSYTYAQRVHFRQLRVLRWSWSYAGIEIPYPALFPLPNLASQPYKNRKSRSHQQPKFPLPTRFLCSNPEYHREKKPDPASRQTYWGPYIRRKNCAETRDYSELMRASSPDLNQGPSDLQCDALPTELSRRWWRYWK